MTTIRLYQFFDSFDISGAVYNFVTKINNLVAFVKGTFATWSTRSAGRRELARLNNRILKDIGITRFEADVEIGKFFWQE